MHFLRPAAAAHHDATARRYLRDGRLTHHAYGIYANLLWSMRPRGSDRVTASYSGLQRYARVCRATVAAAIEQLIDVGLISRIKRKSLELWTNGGRRWRQRPNIYVFHCESTGQTEYPKEAIRITVLAPDQAAVTAAQAALTARRQQIEARLLGRKAQTPGCRPPQPDAR